VSGRVQGGVLKKRPAQSGGVRQRRDQEHLNIERSKLAATSARQAKASAAPQSEAPRQPPKRTRAYKAQQGAGAVDEPASVEAKKPKKVLKPVLRRSSQHSLL